MDTNGCANANNYNRTTPLRGPKDPTARVYPHTRPHTTAPHTPALARPLPLRPRSLTLDGHDLGGRYERAGRTKEPYRE